MKKIPLLISLIFMTSMIYGQDKLKVKEPYYLKDSLKNLKHDKYMVSLSERRLDTIKNGRYAGELIKVNINLNDSKNWKEIDNNRKLLRYEVVTDVGFEIFVNLDIINLPERSELYMFSPDGAYLKDPLNEGDKKTTKKVKSGLIKGKRCMLELIIPKDSSCNIIVNSIGIIIRQGFKEETNKKFGDAGSCHNNVMCSEFSGWCNERHSVARILVTTSCGTLYWCSGSLLTNEKRDGRPYFLTAFHCLDCDENESLSQAEKDEVQNWEFLFNYQSQNCDNQTSDSKSQTIDGAVFRAAYDETDFALLELKDRPLANFNSYYNGWTNDNDNMTGTGVVIHHPLGDIKKISKYDKIQSWDADYWKVEYTDGSTAGGSSGSPLITNGHYVIGQLSRGDAACGNNGHDHYGDFVILGKMVEVQIKT
jgi:V8-like Glu-specific endopeptidase